MSNKLVEIPVDKWSTLRDLYTKRKDRASCYNMLQIFINWKNKEATFPLTIYSLNGDWELDGTFLAKFSGQIFFNTCNDNLDRLLAALNSLDSSETYLLAGYQECVVPAVVQHFVDCGLNREAYKPNGTFWYHISKDQAKQFVIDPPENMCLKPLQESYAEQVNSVWPHRSANSIEFVKVLICQNESIGLFDNNKLVAWCLILPLGSLGLVQVVDTHRLKGFGSLVVRYISKLLAEKNIEVTAPVVFDNVASRSMFEKLGFKIIDKVYWAMKPATK